MAVAVKNMPGTSSASPLDRPSLVGLLGALYVLLCLGVIFKGVPVLWETLGMPRANSLVGGALLTVVMFALTACALWVGAALLHARSVPGSRTGIFVGTVGLLIALLLTRWASLWIEHLSFDLGTFDWKTGAILTGVAGAVFVALVLWGYFHAWTQRQILRIDEMGWFQATSYKPLQGLRVRRGTILGLVILVVAGIWSLISHGTLKRGPADWQIDIPFTGTVAIESYGDTYDWLAGMEVAGLPGLPEAEKRKVEVLTVNAHTPGSPTSAVLLEPKEVVPVATFRQAVKAVLAQHPSLDAKDIDPDGEIVGLLTKINEQINERIQQVLEPEERLFGTEALRSLRELSARTSVTNLAPLIDAVRQEARRAEKEADLGPVFDLPTGLLVVDRYALRDIDARTDPKKFVRVELVPDPDFTRYKEGEIAPTADVEEEVARLKEKRRDFEPPRTETLAPATGETHFANLTLLPSVQYTLPLVLLAAALWFAWRVVNMPTFADFLIATEAELNKVSWTTQRRLMQDTIVVLVTVVLMASYLFGVDQLWRISLSWRPIGVLVIPKEQSEVTTSVEQKKW